MARIFGSFTPTPANEPPPGMYVPIEFPEMLLVGTRTHDGRLIDAPSFSTLDLPRSIKLKVRDAPGHDNAEVSFWNAWAACISTPSDMVPRIYCGAATSSGNTGSKAP